MFTMRDRELHQDPLSGEIGAHPLGVGLGAIAGGAAIGATAGALAGPAGVVAGAAVGAVTGGLYGKAAAEGLDPTVEECSSETEECTCP